MVYKAEVSTNTTYKEYYGVDKIIIRNLSETYLILMTQNYPNTFGR